MTSPATPGSGSEKALPLSPTPPADDGISAPADYRDRTVAITGASGFLGTALRRRLSGAGALVHGISRCEQAPDSAVERWWKLDVAAPGALDELLLKAEPDVLFHLAGETSASRDASLVRQTVSANVVATANVLSSVVEHSPRTRVVTAGSLEEPDADAPATSPYALSKAAAAAYALLFHELYGARTAHLRVFMAYGPGQAALGKLIPYVTCALLKGEPALLTSGARLVDWVFVDDVAAAFAAAGSAGDEVEGRRIDVGTGVGTSVKAVAEELREIVGHGELHFGARPDRGDEVERLADPEPASRLLGWQAATPLAEGLRRTVEWYRKRP